MSEEIDRLWALHCLDEEVHVVRAALARFPGQRRELERHVTEASQRLGQAKLRLVELQRSRRELEREANALADEERRFQTQLVSVKKNEEYTALLHEIENTKRRRSDLETEILVRMEDEEKEQKERPALETVLEGAEREAAAQGRALDAEEAAEQEKLGVLEARRDSNLQRLPQVTRARYERVHASRDGRAVVPIVKGACGGCFRAQPPQILQEARRRDRTLSCEGCGRLIVWPPGDA